MNINKRISMLIIATFTLSCLSGCGTTNNTNTESIVTESYAKDSSSSENSSNSTKPSVATATKKIVDCSGTEVEIPTDINKVVVTNPSAVAFMNAMGLDDKIVGTQ